MNLALISTHNAAHLTPIGQVRCGWITQVVWSPNSRALAVGSGANVRLFSADDLALRGTLAGHSGPVKGVAVNPDGSWVASASADTTIRLWNLGQGGAYTVLRGHSEAVNGVAFDSSGSLLASCSGDQTVRLWHVASGEARHVFHGHSGEVSCVGMTPDLRLVSGGWDNRLRLWNGGDRLIGIHDDWVRDLSVSLEGTRLASASKDETAAVWTLDSCEQVLRFPAHPGGVDAVAFSPDGHVLATGGRDNRVKLWAAATGEQVAELTGHLKPVLSLAFSPDGTRLVSGSGDNSLRLWAVHEIRKKFRDFPPQNSTRTGFLGALFSPESW